ncbi:MULTISPECIES: hypothetical protein [Parafrankia]|uniref:hypothetical protein n=1 Tax=Parafrankia TaxID=2994362 RepID=UPI000DA5737E|nr:MULTISPECIES: hypothetical protein [Parafrankia]SQD95399.1 hypothetical protein FMEAI12_3130005 [Parafrankia sp. Ea1.12]
MAAVRAPPPGDVDPAGATARDDARVFAHRLRRRVPGSRRRGLEEHMKHRTIARAAA